MQSKVNRRNFVGATAFTIVPRNVLGGAAFVPPSDRLTMAHIGMGTQSFRELGSLLNNPAIQITSVCDPNTDSDDYIEWGKGGIQRTIGKLIGNPSWRANHSGCPGGREVGREVIDTYYANQRGAEKFRACSVYGDYRELLEKEKDLDAVKVMTPDHLHATIAIAAMKKGKHVVMHKPIGNRVHEARLTIETNRKTKTETHLLAYGSGELNGKIAAKVKQGIIGKLREIHNWSRRPVWPQYSEIPTDRPPIPKGLDWDLWLGPALYRPFHPHYTHTVFRGWYDFGGGSMADMGIYSLWPIFNELGLGPADSAEATASHTITIVDNVCRKVKNDFSYPAACQLRFHFQPQNLDLFWYDGGMRPRFPVGIEAAGVEMEDEGILFIGDSGVIHAGFRGQNARVYKGSASEPLGIEGGQQRPRGDRSEIWRKAFQGGGSSPGSFLKGGSISDTINLGTVALRAGKKVEFDSHAMKVTNDADANKYLHREYRPGWELS